MNFVIRGRLTVVTQDAKANPLIPFQNIQTWANQHRNRSSTTFRHPGLETNGLRSLHQGREQLPQRFEFLLLRHRSGILRSTAPGLQVSKSSSFQVFKFPSLQVSKSSSFQVFKFPSLQVSKSSSFQVFKFPSLQVSKSSSFQVFKFPSLQVSKSSSFQVFKFPSLQVSKSSSFQEAFQPCNYTCVTARPEIMNRKPSV